MTVDTQLIFRRLDAASVMGIVGVAFAVACGVATAAMGPIGGALVIGLLAAFIGLFAPLQWVVVALFVASFLVVGQLVYFGGVLRALWIPFLIGGLLLVRYPLDRMQRDADRARPVVLPRIAPEAQLCIVVYFATLLVTTLLNASAPLQLVVSGKEYVLLWGLLLVIAAGLLDERFVIRIWTILPWLMPLQIPVVVYQRLVIAPSRQNLGEAWDSVVGIFGGNPMGGGASGAMGLFCVAMMASVVARWRARQIIPWQALLLIASGLFCIVLAEVKFAILMMPIAFALVFAGDKPLKGLITFGAVTLLAFVMLIGYQFQYSRTTGAAASSEYFETLVETSTDSEFINFQTREMGRLTAIRFWAGQHGLSDPLRLLIGHGAGASRVGEVVTGDAAKRYPFNIGRSALAILLWETGIVGAAAFLLLLGSTVVRLYRHAARRNLPSEARATAIAMATAVVLLGFGLPYNTDLLFSHQSQLLLMLCMGYAAILNSSRRRAVAGASAPIGAQ